MEYADAERGETVDGPLRPRIEATLRTLFPGTGRAGPGADRTAIHEAGHAVIGAVLGHPFDWVTAMPEEIDLANVRLGCVSGAWSPARWDRSRDSEEDDWYLGALTIVCAGVEAEGRYTGRRFRLGKGTGSADGEHATRIIERLYNAPKTEAARRKLLAWHRREAARLVEVHWPAIVQTARELLARERLTFAEVLEISGARAPEWWTPRIEGVDSVGELAELFAEATLSDTPMVEMTPEQTQRYEEACAAQNVGAITTLMREVLDGAAPNRANDDAH